MVSADRFPAFCALAAVVIAIPGPSVLFVVGRALAHGRSVSLASVAGNELGELVIAVLVAAGLGPLVARSALLLTVLKLAGAAYLIFLGAPAIAQRRVHQLGEELAGRPRGRMRSVAAGFAVDVAKRKD